MDNTAKIRPILLAKILYERTDDDHSLTTTQLMSILKSEHGIETYRSTIKSDIMLLQQLGYEIQEVKSTQNHYNVIGRKFDIPELRLLVDAVRASRFITPNKSEELVSKLETMASIYETEKLKRNLCVTGRYKPENERIYLIVDAIHEAIYQRRKISFQKIEYNLQKEKVLHNNGETYVFSPYSLVWDGDYYYVVGYSDKYGSIGSHRVDRIAARPKILEEGLVSAPETFNLNNYVNSMFRMFNGDGTKIELLCDNDVIDSVIDHFGQDVEIEEHGDGTFTARAEVAVSHIFFSWIFGFCGKVKILGPEEVVQKYREMAVTATF